MQDIKKYHKGDTLFYLGRNECTVIRNTLLPGDSNAEQAILFLKTK